MNVSAGNLLSCNFCLLPREPKVKQPSRKGFVAKAAMHQHAMLHHIKTLANSTSWWRMQCVSAPFEEKAPRHHHEFEGRHSQIYQNHEEHGRIPLLVETLKQTEKARAKNAHTRHGHRSICDLQAAGNAQNNANSLQEVLEGAQFPDRCGENVEGQPAFPIPAAEWILLHPRNSPGIDSPCFCNDEMLVNHHNSGASQPQHKPRLQRQWNVGYITIRTAELPSHNTNLGCRDLMPKSLHMQNVWFCCTLWIWSWSKRCRLIQNPRSKIQNPKSKTDPFLSYPQSLIQCNNFPGAAADRR